MRQRQKSSAGPSMLARTLLILAALVASTTMASAQGWGPHRHWHHHHSGPGAFVGGVLGGILGGVIANQYRAPAPAPDPVAWCMARYRSYNPETGVYLAFDGTYRRCP